MTLFDSSVLIDYLAGDDEVVTYAEAHAHEDAYATRLILYEVYLGEVHKPGEPDFDSLDDALEWVAPVGDVGGPHFGRWAAELMHRLMEAGTQLSHRDGLIAASAWALNDRLVTRDSDFDAPAVRQEIDVELV